MTVLTLDDVHRLHPWPARHGAAPSIEFLWQFELAAAPAASAATKPTAAASQKERMKSCNAQAKDKSLKGDARKSFMSECLKA